MGLKDSSKAPLLQCKQISKSFGGVEALKKVSLDIYPGEVHGLIGANGAGKSTLIKIISGDISQDSGEILFEGKPLSLNSPQDAYKLGFSFIHQELNLVPKFSVIENLTLGMEKETKFGLIHWQTVSKRITEVLNQIGLDLPLNTIVDTLSVADQWLVSIAHALMRNIKMICMDEPTASLSAEESTKLFKVIENLTSNGVAVLYVSHRLDEIMELCSGISVFKDGECVLTTNKAETTRDELVTAIVGRKGIAVAQEASQRYMSNNIILSAKNISWGNRVNDVSFDLQEGRIIGFAGLVGAGRTELANLIFGVEQPDAGSMELEGKPYHPKHVAEAISLGIGLVPEERRSQGLVLKDSVKFNINMLNLKSIRFSKRLGLINNSKMTGISKNIVDRLQIKTPNVNTA
ncbi:MAG: sugar ABC transporter ATP-binding protein, partial [Sphaerochaetaceae bacterium]